MSEGATAQRNSSKRSRCSNDGGSGCAAAASGGCVVGHVAAAFGGSAANQAGNTKQDGSTTSPLAAALVLKDKFIVSLHIMSQPFLQPLSTSVLSKFATAYYAEAKHIETKSDQNYVSKSVKGLGFLLQGLPEVEQSEGFKALHNDLTIDLKKNPISSSDVQFWLDQIQANVLINQKGTTWRSLTEEEKNASKTASGVIDLALHHPSSIKRPVAIWPDNKVTVGFSPDSWLGIAQEYRLV